MVSISDQKQAINGHFNAAKENRFRADTVSTMPAHQSHRYNTL